MNYKKRKNKVQKNFKYNATWSDRIHKLIGDNKCRQALREINSYLEKYPKDDRILTVLGKCYLKMGETEEAEKVANHLIENESSEKARALFLLASISSQKGDFDAEEKYYEASAKLGYSLAKHSLAIVKMRNKEYKSALEIMNSIDLKDYNYNFYLTKATLLFEIGNIKEALKIIENYSLEDMPKNLYSLFARTKAVILVANKKYNEAMEGLEDYTNNYATTIEYNHILLIERYIENKYYQKAISLIEDVANCDDELLRSYAKYYRAKVYKNVQNIEKSKKELLKLVNELESKKENDDIISKVYNDLGSLELLDRNYIKAREYYSKIDTKENKNFTFNKNMKLAIIEFRLGNINKALEIVNLSRNIPNCKDEDSRIYKQLSSSIKKALGISFTPNTYFERQLNNYNIDDAVKNSSKLHSTGAIFNENIDVSKLISEVPNLISDSNMIYNGIIEKYRIYYENIGTVLDTITNYMDVVTLPDSKKVITMFPVVNTLESELRFREEKDKTKKKTKMSQIDKFNAKYNK